MEKSSTYIVLDFGHSKVDPINGKVSPDKTLYEWKSNRELGYRIYNKLKELGYHVSTTVQPSEDNVKVSLSTRAARVNSLCNRVGTKNVIMISIHSNAAGAGQWMNGRGWEVWVASNASQGSKNLAISIYDEVSKIHGIKMRPSTPKQKYKTKDLTVLYKAKCKCCLTESLFYDNKEDLKMLKDPQVREALADAHVKGIISFINSHNF